MARGLLFRARNRASIACRFFVLRRWSLRLLVDYGNDGEVCFDR